MEEKNAIALSKIMYFLVTVMKVLGLILIMGMLTWFFPQFSTLFGITFTLVILWIIGKFLVTVL